MLRMYTTKRHPSHPPPWFFGAEMSRIPFAPISVYSRFKSFTAARSVLDYLMRGTQSRTARNQFLFDYDVVRSSV